MHLFGRGNAVGGLSDPDVLAYARETFGAVFAMHFDAVTRITCANDAVVVDWVNRNDTTDSGEERVDFLLAATGRRPTLNVIGLENPSLVPDARATPRINPQSMQAETKGSRESSIFATGDAAVDGFASAAGSGGCVPHCR